MKNKLITLLFVSLFATKMVKAKSLGDGVYPIWKFDSKLIVISAGKLTNIDGTIHNTFYWQNKDMYNIISDVAGKLGKDTGDKALDRARGLDSIAYSSISQHIANAKIPTVNNLPGYPVWVFGDVTAIGTEKIDKIDGTPHNQFYWNNKKVYDAIDNISWHKGVPRGDAAVDTMRIIDPAGMQKIQSYVKIAKKL